MRKKLLSAILAIVMLVAVIPVMALPTGAVSNSTVGYKTTVTTDVLAVDGQLDDAYLKSDQIKTVYKSSASNEANDFVAYAAANAQGLYVWAAVEDTTQFHAKDRLTIYFNFRAMHNSEDNLANSYMHVNVNPGSSTVFSVGGGYETGLAPVLSIDDITTAFVKQDGVGYTAEIFIPWQDVADKVGAKSDTALPVSIGFEAHDYDSTGTHLSYSGDSTSSNVNLYYNTFYLYNVLNYVPENDMPEIKIAGSIDRMAAYSASAIAVDGVMDSVYTGGTKITFDAIGSEKDANDYAYVSFTDNDIYVFINMTDTSNDAAKDNVKVYHRFFTRTNSAGIYYVSGAYQFNRNNTVSQPGHHYNGHISSDIDINGMSAIEYKIVDNPGVGYTIEIKYPLSAAEKELINKSVGMTVDFGFESHNNTTYNACSVAGSHFQAWKSAQIIPSVHLVKDVVSYSIIPQITGATISLGEDISMNYYTMLSPLDADAQMRFTFNGKTYFANAKKSGYKNQYIFTFDGIAPQCMGDNIKAELIVDGEMAFNVDNYSVLENCQHLLESADTSAEAKQLIYDLLSYGAAAQKYKQYKTQTLVNAGYEMLATKVTSIENNDRKVSPATISGARISAAGVYYDNVNKVYAKITVDGADVSKLKATVNGVTADIKHYRDNEYIVYSEAIKVADFNDVYTIVVHDGKDSQTLVYSINAYAKAKISSSNTAMAELAKATYAYGQSARAYVNSLARAEVNITNLYDKSLAFAGYVDGNNDEKPSAVNYTSDYISVTPGEKIYFGPCKVAQDFQLHGYDSSMNISQKYVGLSDKSVFTVEATFDNGYVIYSYVIPSNTVYVRIANPSAYNNVYMISREPITLDGFKAYWGEGNTLDLYSPDSKINNLYDKSVAFAGYISNTGVENVHSAHYTSHYISVFPGEKIYFGPCKVAQDFQLHAYDTDHNNVHAYVSKSSFTVEATFDNGYVIYSYVIPSDTYYIRTANPSAYNDVYTVARGPITLKNFKEYWGEGNTLDLYPLYEKYTSAAFTGKSALFLGDSICAANCESGKTYQGWSGRIQIAAGMTCTNKGVSGASISTSRGTNVVYNHYSEVRSNNYDFIIMHGGVNDAWDSVSVGAMTDSFDPADFNTATYAGGLENLFYYVTTEHPNAKLGYIFNFATPSFTTGNIEDMSAYYAVAKQICAKWNIPYLNMYEDSNLTAELKVNTTEHLSDLLHPDTSGYDILYTYIMYWMETLPVNSTVTDAYDLETLPSEVAK